MANLTNLYYRHLDGGYYRLVTHANSADIDGQEVVVYQHLWPFDSSWWVRERQDFESRFSTVTPEEITAAMQGDRLAAQQAVDAAKAARRAAKAAQ